MFGRDFPGVRQKMLGTVIFHILNIVHFSCISGRGRVVRRDAEDCEMTLDRAVLFFAGVMILVSLALTLWVSPLWMWFTVFIAANLIQSSFTGFCPAAMIFKLFGVKGGCAFE
jgi:hypothetical protein